jgi:catechol 2,3-dioxygenase-like lactoylglutathione lyase family enzyme
MITSIDHIVMTAADPDATIAFYCDILGMELQSFQPADGSPVRPALCFGNQKINLHDAASPYVPHARQPVAGAVDLCFLSDVPIADWQERFAANDIALEHGPVEKTGATGPLWSVYVRDPDGNLIEISNRMPADSSAAHNTTV